eukprot:TRINITY_DN26438_c0_g1_i1.p1 TRINITY_DN26438_c0_g1~~TRINITY_DN26438_c0_g1_i1.p1  ORF type:complete len:151 (+),score=55.79 TRINITY_DN26438_c0_g1_i1:41-493(+)
MIKILYQKSQQHHLLSFRQSPTIFAILCLNGAIGYFMMNIKQTFVALLLSTSLFSFAEEANVSTTPGYISEDLIVYMHTGAGKNYRIQGTVNSGEQVQLTGNTNNNYSEIITDKNRTGWVESKYVSAKTGPHVLCVDTGRSSETAKAHRG